MDSDSRLKVVKLDARDIISFVMGMGHTLPENVIVSWGRKSVTVKYDAAEVRFKGDGSPKDSAKTIVQQTWAV